MTRIASWNVNGIRAAGEKGLFSWLHARKPDILCLQETKAQSDQLSADFLEPDGYRSFFISAKKKGYSGVAIYTREKPRSVSPLGVAEFDREGRILAAEYGDFILVNAYFPNSQAEGARLSYKLEFCQAIRAFCDALVADGKDVIVCGDFNIAHKPIDLTHPKANEGNPGYLPEERAWMDSFIGAGYVDTFRIFTSEGGHYTWWSYRMNARGKNVGWRIDYHCVNQGMRERVREAVILPEVTGSDHCPIELTVE